MPAGPNRSTFTTTWYQTPHDTIISALCAEDDKVVSAGIDSQVILWTIRPDGEKSTLSHTLQRKMGSHTCGATCVDMRGDTLATCTNDGAIRVWDLKSGTNTTTLPGNIGNAMWCRWADEGHLISAGIDGELCIWDVNVTSEPKKFKIADCAVQDLSVSGTQVAFGGLDGSVGIFDTSSQQVTVKGKMHNQTVRSVCLVNDKIFSASDDGTVVVSDPKKLNDVKDQGAGVASLMSFSGHKNALTGEAGAVYGLAVNSSDDSLCMSCGADGKSLIWDWENRKILQEFHNHKDGAWAAASMSVNDEPVFLSGGRDRGVCIYTLPSMYGEGSEAPDIEHFVTAGEF